MKFFMYLIKHVLEVSLLNFIFFVIRKTKQKTTLLEKAKLAREISDGKNEIPHKFLGRKI